MQVMSLLPTMQQPEHKVQKPCDTRCSNQNTRCRNHVIVLAVKECCIMCNIPFVQVVQLVGCRLQWEGCGGIGCADVDW
ncbi:hypothetical protein C1H46_000431 [Malus baccata]|uniref:Uncharacterized protein n=1 Tax=Malus baccata TaxID=106549 RepID=A0A540NSM4_MALBA|nr:hypothetical protein C1H46_000431 [Malus baccata]